MIRGAHSSKLGGYPSGMQAYCLKIWIVAERAEENPDLSMWIIGIYMVQLDFETG